MIRRRVRIFSPVSVAIIVLWAWGAANVGRLDYEDALIRDAMRKDPPQAVYMTQPLGCGQWIAQSGDGKQPRVWLVCADLRR